MYIFTCFKEFKNLPYLWEKIVDEPYLKIWKLPYKKSGIFQYKGD